jgi:hypothetical protein
MAACARRRLASLVSCCPAPPVLRRVLLTSQVLRSKAALPPNATLSTPSLTSLPLVCLSLNAVPPLLLSSTALTAAGFLLTSHGLGSKAAPSSTPIPSIQNSVPDCWIKT